MQTDVILVHAERRLLGRAEQAIVLVDSSKFNAPAGHVVCAIEDIDILVTDPGIKDADAQTIERSGIQLVIAPDGKG